MVEKDLLYTKDHEWARVEGNTVTVGITHYAQEMLGEITFVELPEVDGQFKFHDEIAVVESTKAASEIYCPVAGKVAEVNSRLESSPELINEQCYGDGWLCKLTVTGNVPKDKLMDAAAYEAYLKEL